VLITISLHSFDLTIVSPKKVNSPPAIKMIVPKTIATSLFIFVPLTDRNYAPERVCEVRIRGESRLVRRCPITSNCRHIVESLAKYIRPRNYVLLSHYFLFESSFTIHPIANISRPASIITYYDKAGNENLSTNSTISYDKNKRRNTNIVGTPQLCYHHSFLSFSTVKILSSHPLV
jgi:hypothetical protein